MATQSSSQQAPFSCDTAEELAELRSRLAALERTQAEAKLNAQRKRNRWTAGVLALVLVAGTVAVAAPGDCPNGMAFCFAADEPAVAAQVNENFAQLRGLNAVWFSHLANSFALNSPSRTVVTSVTVPAGTYVVSGKLYGVAGATPASGLLCNLFAGSTNLDFTNTQPTNSYSNLSLLGSVVMAASGPITLECLASTQYSLYGVTLVATPVTALN